MRRSYCRLDYLHLFLSLARCLLLFLSPLLPPSLFRFNSQLSLACAVVVVCFILFIFFSWVKQYSFRNVFHLFYSIFTPSYYLLHSVFLVCFFLIVGCFFSFDPCDIYVYVYLCMEMCLPRRPLHYTVGIPVVVATSRPDA